MEKIMIDEPHQWMEARENRVLTKDRTPVYVNELVVGRFVSWAITRAKITGFAYGLGFSVFIAVLVKLMGK